LVISNPRPIPPEFDELLLSDFEARAVASHFPSDVLAGRDADSKTVLERLPTARVAHFSCHGTVDSRFGYAGVLLLANTEVLSYAHLRELPELVARLVVLSACRSGSAALTVEHSVSLPNAFLAAGSAAVLGTFWHTDELASLLLLGRFYDLWLDKHTHRTPREALGDAQAWLMTTPAQTFRAILEPEVLESPASKDLKQARSDDRIYSDPWFWGGFFLAGA
jgi:CHAT domain-containing protein